MTLLDRKLDRMGKMGVKKACKYEAKAGLPAKFKVPRVKVNIKFRGVK